MSDKTPIKTAKPSGRNGNVLPLGAHPGNTGGKKGRSGRKPNKFIEWAHAVTEDQKVQDVNMAKAKAGDLEVLKFAANYAHGKPKEAIELTGKDGDRLTIALRIFEHGDADD